MRAEEAASQVPDACERAPLDAHALVLIGSPDRQQLRVLPLRQPSQPEVSRVLNRLVTREADVLGLATRTWQPGHGVGRRFRAGWVVVVVSRDDDSYVIERERHVWERVERRSAPRFARRTSNGLRDWLRGAPAPILRFGR